MPKRGQNQTDFSDVSGVSPRKKKVQEIHPQEETGGSTSAVEENLVSADLLLSFIFRRRHRADSFDEYCNRVMGLSKYLQFVETFSLPLYLIKGGSYQSIGGFDVAFCSSFSKL